MKMTTETNYEEIQQQDEDIASIQKEKSPALTIVIQTWATPIIAIVMLAFGLFGGYYGRPLLVNEMGSVADDESSPANQESTLTVVPTPDENLAVKQQELMAAVVENTRHFRGKPDAPVTIIEFSDFQ
jgi:hypothetical protein